MRNYLKYSKKCTETISAPGAGLPMATKVIEITPSKTGGMQGGSRTILPLKNAVTHQNCAELEATLQECIDNNKTEIILDCRALTFLDSEALELLVRMHEDANSRGSELKLISLNKVCSDILIATRLMNILNVYKDIHGAIKKWL